MKRILFLALLLCSSLQQTLAQHTWIKVKEKLVFSNPPFKACHASTLVEVNKGEVLLACFGGSRESEEDVSIWMASLSRLPAKAKKVADGVISDSLRYAAWNPVLFKAQSGKISLFYKVGPSPREWWGMVKYSTDQGKTWSAATKLKDGILGPIKNKPVALKPGLILSPSSIEEHSGRWKVFIERSTDGGKSWISIPVDTAGKFDVIQPSILSYADGRLQLLCRSKQGHVITSWSSDEGISWSPLSPTSLLNPNSGTDAVTLKNGEQLIVYNPDIPGKDWFNGRGKLRVASSKNGVDWTDIAVLEDGDKEEYSYPAIIQTSNGDVHISYTFDRKNIKYVILRQTTLNK